MLKALKILESIHSQMNKEEIMLAIIAAKTELALKDTAQVAHVLGVAKGTVIKRAIYHNIGTVLAPRARVYSPSDVDKLRGLTELTRRKIGRPPNPETAVMIKKMQALRRRELTMAEIGRKFKVSESYVSKLLQEKNE